MMDSQSITVCSTESDLAQFLADQPDLAAGLQLWGSEMRTRLGFRRFTRDDVRPNREAYLVCVGRICDPHQSLTSYANRIQLTARPLLDAQTGDPQVAFTYPDQAGSFESRPLSIFLDPYGEDFDPAAPIDSHYEVWVAN